MAINSKQLNMDTDYSDLAYCGRTDPQDIDRLFEQMHRAGFDATIWDSFWCGTALYHSDLLPVFSNHMKWESPVNISKVLTQFDPLAHALECGRQTGIRIMPYFRMLEEAYAPFDGNPFFRDNPEFWWQSKCGLYRMVGWPCYNYPEVREHMLSRVDDLIAHGVEAIFFDAARTHIPYFCAYSLGMDLNSFGFNKPVVEEFKKRYGIDISEFDHIEEVRSIDRDGMPFVYDYKWAGGPEYDIWAFKRILGEGIEKFIREVKAKYPHLYIALQTGPMECGGQYDEAPIATFRLDLEGLCKDGIINEYSVPANYRVSAPDIDSYLFPRFQYVKESDIVMTAWLNDFLTPAGGGGKVEKSIVEQYVNRILESRIDGIFIHESQFIYDQDDPEFVWKQIARIKAQ